MREKKRGDQGMNNCLKAGLMRFTLFFLFFLQIIFILISNLSFAQSLEDAKKLDNQVIQLYQQGRYEEAIPIARQVLAIREKLQGPNHPDVATSLNNLAALYRATGRYGEAESLYKRSLEIYETRLGKDHPDVATSLNNLAVLCGATGRYGEAERLYKRSLEIWEARLGKDHPDVATSLNNLAELYKAARRYAEAEPLYRRSLEIYEKRLGKDHPSVVTTLDNLVALFRDMDRYAEAEPFLRRSLEIKESRLGPDHPDITQSINDLAELYKAARRYAEAEPLYRRALEIEEKNLGKDHQHVAYRLYYSLAFLYEVTGRYGEAEPLLRRALEIREKRLGRDHPDVADSLFYLASHYQVTGRYGEAEPLLRRALQIMERWFGGDHPNVAFSLFNLALHYQDTGRYGEAEPLFRRALEIEEKKYGKEHPYLGPNFSGLARLYQATGRYAEAEPLYRRSLEIREEGLGRDHPDVAYPLNDLAELYRATGRYAEAEPLLRRARELEVKEYSKEHFYRTPANGKLALLYLESGRLEEAYKIIKERGLARELGKYYVIKKDYSQAKKEFSRSLGESKKEADPGFIIADHIGLGLAYEGMKEYPKAKEHFKEAIDIIESQWKTLSPEAKKGFLTGQIRIGFSRLDPYEGMIRVLLKERGKGAGLESLSVAERIKGRIFLEMLATREVRGRGKEDEAILRRDREFQQSLLSLRKQVEVMEGVKRGVTEGELRRLKDALNEKEKEYTIFIEEVKLKNSELSTLLTVDPPSLSKIQSLLDSDVTLLEYYTTKEKIYAWLLTRNDIQVYEIALSEKELKERVDQFLLPNISNRSRKAEPVMVFVSKAELKETTEEERKGNREKFLKSTEELYTLLVAPIKKGIKTEKLIIVPHGVLHKVPFTTLSDGKRYLIDKYSISILPSSSVSEFVVKKRKSQKEKLLALANPQTDYIPLGFAEVEGKAISALFPKSEVYYRERATETLAKKRGSDFNIIHFASHGEFNERQPLQSGLLLAKDDENDGYLQVHEIFGMDLRNANLVTLSACETALSKVTGGDDLVGLSRGFIYAGTPSLLATLWKVDDASTAKLMELFYRNWQQGMSKPEALRQAQIALKAMPQYKHPYYWAPFVMIGDWR